MVLTGECRSTGSKKKNPVPMPLFPSQIPHGVILDGTQVLRHREPTRHPLQTLLLLRILKQPTHTSGAKPLNL